MKKYNLFNWVDTSTALKKAQFVIEEMRLSNVEFKYSGGCRGWPGDVPQVRFNCSKINNIGWQARYTSDESVMIAIKSIVKELGEKRCK